MLILFFNQGIKSFELSNSGKGWFDWIERGKRISCKIKIDEENLWRVCEALKQASKRAGNYYRQWGWKSQAYYYRVFVNFNYYGRFIRIETWLVSGKKSIIIPKLFSSWVGGDIADKILHFLGNQSTNRYRPIYTHQTKSYVDTTKIV